MADDDHKALEEELELQLKEQKESLISLNDALKHDPSDSELIAVSFPSLIISFYYGFRNFYWFDFHVILRKRKKIECNFCL